MPVLITGIIGFFFKINISFYFWIGFLLNFHIPPIHLSTYSNIVDDLNKLDKSFLNIVKLTSYNLMFR